MKRYSKSYVGTFNKGDEDIQFIRNTIKTLNKKLNRKFYVKLAGRGTNRVAKMTKYYEKEGWDTKFANYFARKNSQSYIPVPLATTVDVYIYERYCS